MGPDTTLTLSITRTKSTQADDAADVEDIKDKFFWNKQIGQQKLSEYNVDMGRESKYFDIRVSVIIGGIFYLI